ncbi:MAG: DUF2752 domain-containing protein [Pirellulales bacterium]|nr:DUF2752 domain-containing protein [Pirellulales bacterium]
MERTTEEKPAALRGRARFGLAVCGVLLAIPLIVAVWLSPDARGYGTHERLGLPPCTFWVLFGKPCPSCGMTTSWAHTVRGELPSAIAANAGGALLALIAAAGVPWTIASAVRGKLIGGRHVETVLVTLAVVAAGVTMFDWLERLIFE